MTVKLHPFAEEDLKEALDYYADIDAKLEKKFIADLESTFDRILKFPNLYPYETETSQKILMEVFPYIVLYEQYQDMIIIFAIFHTSRDDKKLRLRKQQRSKRNK